MEIQSDIVFDYAQNEIVAMDFGNTRVKTYINGMFYSNVYIQPDWKKLLKEKITKASRKVTIFYTSVYEQQTDEFIAFMGPSPKVRFYEVTILLDKTGKLNYNHIKGIGTDRLLGLIGAAGKYAEPPLIVLDCGTAVTINVLGESSVVKGGAIFPGLYTSARALFDYTSSLEFVHFKGPYLPHCGTTTNHAIKTGLLCSLIGGLKEAVRLFESELFEGKELPLVITGGYGNMVFELLKDWRHDIKISKTLILEGIVSLADEFAKPSKEPKIIREKPKKKSAAKKKFVKRDTKKPTGKLVKKFVKKDVRKKPFTGEKDGNVKVIEKPVIKDGKQPLTSEVVRTTPKKKRIPLRRKI